MTRVAVAGGTRVVGRHVVEVLLERGHQPVVMSRSRGVDVLSGEGLDAAPAGAGAVVDVTSMATLRRAAALVGLVEGGAVGRAPDPGGPEQHDLVDLAHRVAAVRSDRGAVPGLPVPGAAGRAIAAGALLPRDDARSGRTTFDQWLAAGRG